MQGDVSNSIFIRKNLLRSTFELVHSKVIIYILPDNCILFIPFMLLFNFVYPLLHKDTINICIDHFLLTENIFPLTNYKFMFSCISVLNVDA